MHIFLNNFFFCLTKTGKYIFFFLLPAKCNVKVIKWEIICKVVSVVWFSVARNFKQKSAKFLHIHLTKSVFVSSESNFKFHKQIYFRSVPFFWPSSLFICEYPLFSTLIGLTQWGWLPHLLRGFSPQPFWPAVNRGGVAS